LLDFILAFLILIGQSIIDNDSTCMAQNPWIKKSDMLTGRWDLSNCVVDGKIYVMGGYGRGKQVDEYYPAKNIWARKTDMPIYTTNQATCVLNGKIYVLGGEDGPPPRYPDMTKVSVYDPGTDSWKTAPELPTGRIGLRASTLGDRIYAIGGMEYWGSIAIQTVEEFDPHKVSAGD
jgi:N-acetylneuraminic acid mutarotase